MALDSEVAPAVAPEIEYDAKKAGNVNVDEKSVSKDVALVGDSVTESPGEERMGTRARLFAYMKTREFWMTLILGQVLALANISSSTFTTLLDDEGTVIPAFQTFFNYVLLNIVYTSFTIYKYGFKGWARLVWRDGWRYIILAFFDVEGNYFVVLAYDYTTLLSAELFGLWTIVVVVTISLVLLKVRYHLTQYIGIFIACAGLGLLIASDYLRGADYSGSNRLKGDLFALLGDTMYGFSNCYEEFMVSKRPMYEVIGQLGFWGMIINGTQAAIFDRPGFRKAVWNGKVGGYLTGYTLVLFIFYTLAPIMFRISSATFFNISMLTMNFWGLIMGLEVFHYTVPALYPVAFVMIIIGFFVYFLTEGVLGEAKKPWLGDDQQKGVEGLGTGRRAQQSGHLIV
ncbi:hypothetical protein ASPZODRAFT_538202 [Penicilliopsis zonata CBS 506.65]|uniref:EamA domain-containing protein n=1 Tax=Penicilliopsis zonata CBS 506.65 TaxID=1073090 RepID=A0A1L9SFB9_9EURO|nr:hypothetical protein ASPZODRAFT_538202 [Penicilliopsis zonata CBS 506.65]OJJ45869.1 hypothetical protein ASPZODRAFT_538202 [Penicilliopsis zonata CBS 506.65]